MRNANCIPHARTLYEDVGTALPSAKARQKSATYMSFSSERTSSFRSEAHPFTSFYQSTLSMEIIESNELESKPAKMHFLF